MKQNLRKFYLFMLKQTHVFRAILAVITAICFSLWLFCTGPEEDCRTTTHGIRLPAKYEEVKRVDLGFREYMVLAQNQTNTFLEINPTKDGSSLILDYYFKDRETGVMMHASDEIQSPHYNILAYFEPAVWKIEEDKLVVKRQLKIAKHAATGLLVCIFFYCVSFLIINGFITMLFSGIATKIELAEKAKQ